MKMKNKIHGLCGALLGALCLSAGCSSYEEPGALPAGGGQLYIKVDPSTYSADANELNSCESTIEKLRVYVFNADGSLDNMITAAAFPVKVRVSPGVKRVMVVANEPASAAGYLAAANTANGVEQVMYDLSDYLPVQDGLGTAYFTPALGTNVTASSTGYTLPMYGEATGVSVTYADTETAPKAVSVGLSRSVARIDVYIRKKPGITAEAKLSSYDTRLVIKNYPDNELNYPNPPWQPVSRGGKGAGFLASAHIAGLSSGFYQGRRELETNTDLTLSGDYQHCYSFYAPETDYSTYYNKMLNIALYNMTWNGVFKTYMPPDISWEESAFGPTLKKLERNKVYIVRWTLTPGMEDIDVDIEVCPWDVAPIQTEPVVHSEVTNCYMVAPGGEARIPLGQIYDAYATHPELGGPLSETAAVTVEQLWEEVASSGWMRALSIEGTGSNRDKYIKVGVNSRGASGDPYVNPLENNVSIALKLGGEIVWSFHIWITDYDPNHPANQRISPQLPGVVMMDRCLGEGTRSNTLYYPSLVGLAYQWGRKDPFVGRKFESGGSPSAGSWTLRGYFADEFADPMTLFEYRGLEYDENGLSKTLDAASLWYGQNGKKTIYDPCPRGWKVMPRTVYDATGGISRFTYHPNSGYGYGNDSFFRHADWGDFSMLGCWLDTRNTRDYGEAATLWVTSPSTGSEYPENNYWEIVPPATSTLLSSHTISPSTSPYAQTAMVRCVRE